MSTDSGSDIDEQVDKTLEREAAKHNLNPRQVKLMLKNMMKDSDFLSFLVSAASKSGDSENLPIEPSRSRRMTSQHLMLPDQPVNSSIPMTEGAANWFSILYGEDEEDDEYNYLEVFSFSNLCNI